MMTDEAITNIYDITIEVNNNDPNVKIFNILLKTLIYSLVVLFSFQKKIKRLYRFIINNKK